MRRIGAIRVALLAAALLTAGARAQERTRAVEVNGNQRQAGVDVSLELRARDRSLGQDFRSVCNRSCSRGALAPSFKLALGNEVAVCFKANQDGFVTVWSIDSRGAQDLIYPNSYSHPGNVRGAQVRADVRTCIGEKDDKFRLTITEPVGKSRVYLYWTRTLDEQIGMDDYPVIGRDARAAAPPYAATNLEYEIVGGH